MGKVKDHRDGFKEWLNRPKQPDLHMPGWPEVPFQGQAKTDGTIYWWEERMPDGSIKRHPLQPYCPIADSAPLQERPSRSAMVDLVAAIIQDEAKYDINTNTWDVAKAAEDIVTAFKKA